MLKGKYIISEINVFSHKNDYNNKKNCMITINLHFNLYFLYWK